MNSIKISSSLHKIATAYQKQLVNISEKQFQASPPIGGWSYSEVYAHIFDASILSLETIEDCLNGKGKDKPTAFIVKLILFYGSLPPGKYKAPEILASRIRYITKDEAFLLIGDFLKRLDKDVPKISTARPQIKTKHPKLGYLNAIQWLRFTEIHLRHHFKQLKRIEKSFS